MSLQQMAILLMLQEAFLLAFLMIRGVVTGADSWNTSTSAELEGTLPRGHSWNLIFQMSAVT